MSAAEATNKVSDTAAAPTVAPMAAPRQVPDWLKGDLFLDLLRRDIADFKSIINFAAKPSQGAGENYATLMALVEIDVELKSGKTQQISYMIKLPLQMALDFMVGYKMFDIESTVYRDVIPELEKLYSDAGVEVKFAPKFYDLQAPCDSGVILMEDLRQRGFKNANRLEGLDMEHTKAALKKLAQWHAASAVRVATKGPYPKIVSTGIFTAEFVEMCRAMNEPMMKLYGECIRTYEGHEEYFDAVLRGQEKTADNMSAAIHPDPSEFNVLSHGDFWCNNIMFQYDSFGKIEQTYFVDFQCTRYGSPVFDLYNVLLSSTQYEIKLKHFDYFIKHYHDQLTECLKLLNYTEKLPTLKELHMMLYKYGFWGFSICAGHMAIVLLDPTESANIENLVGTTTEGIEFKRQMYTNERYRKHAEAVLPWLNNRGAFE